MSSGFKSLVRRFKISLGDVDTTLSSRELVTIGVYSEAGNRIVLVEHSPNDSRTEGQGWGRKHVLVEDKDPHVIYIPETLAGHYIAACLRKVVMNRYDYHGDDGVLWTINEFLELNAPLALAEVSVAARSTSIKFPRWVNLREEVSGDLGYDFYQLASVPWSKRRK